MLNATLNEVKASKASEKVNFVGLVKFSKSYQVPQKTETVTTEKGLVSIDDSYKGTFYFTKANGELKVDKYGDASVDFSNPETLTNFINKAVNEYPAEKYMFILWDHGYVFDESDIPLTRSMLQDDNVDKCVTIYEIEEGIKNSSIQKFDVLYADMCLTENIETLYQFSTITNYYIGSANLVPGIGGDYTKLINGLIDGSDLITDCKSYIDKNIKLWEAEDSKVRCYQDLSLLDLRNIQPVVESFKKVSSRYIKLYQDNKDIKLSLDSIQMNGYKEYKVWNEDKSKVVRWENYGKFYFFDCQYAIRDSDDGIYVDNPNISDEVAVGIDLYTATDLYASFAALNKRLNDKELSDNLAEMRNAINNMTIHRAEIYVPELYKDIYHAAISLKWMTKSRSDGYLLNSDTPFHTKDNITTLYPYSRFGAETKWHEYFQMFDVDKDHRLKYYEVKDSDPFLVGENI